MDWVSELLSNGFAPVGAWTPHLISIVPPQGIPSAPGVYAFILGGEVVYIGLSQVSLKKRIEQYQNPGPSQSTNIRLKREIRRAMRNGGRVEILVCTPPQGKWNGLPVDISAGLEAGLIKAIQPPWNQTGTKRKK